MLEGKKILWAMNVFSGVKHLAQQQEVVRHVFGNDVTIMTFCNHPDPAVKPHYKEDRLSRIFVNSGHHTGVRDAHNETLSGVDGFDLVISSHADNLFQDYTVVPEIIRKMNDEGKLLACLQATEGECPHNRVIKPMIYNDFFIADVEMWKRAGTIEVSCDGDRLFGIEITLGMHFMNALDANNEILVIPARFEDQNHPHRFIDTWRPGMTVLRENLNDVKDEWIRNNCPEYSEVLRKAGLL